MKIITKDEEEAHYSEVIKGGLIGGSAGLAVGLAGVVAASRRWTAFRNLTPSFRAFLVSSTTTGGAIILAERNSIEFARSRDASYGYKDESQRVRDLIRENESAYDRAMAWGKEHRYTIVSASWVASIAVALALVSRNKYLTTAQKVVEARVYAQGLTVAVLLATAVFEVSDAKNQQGRWETVMIVDPNDPEHKKLIEKRVHKEEYQGQDLWMDMVASEERRLARVKKEKEAKAAAAEAAAKPAESKQ